MSDGELPQRKMVMGVPLQIISDVAVIRELSGIGRAHDDFVSNLPQLVSPASVKGLAQTNIGVRRNCPMTLGKIVNDGYAPRMRGLGELAPDANIANYIKDSKGTSAQSNTSVQIVHDNDFVTFLNPKDSIYDVVIEQKSRTSTRTKNLIGQWQPWGSPKETATNYVLHPGDTQTITLKESDSKNVDTTLSLTDTPITASEVQRRNQAAKDAADKAAADELLRKQKEDILKDTTLTPDQKKQMSSDIDDKLNSTTPTSAPIDTKYLIIGGIIAAIAIGGAVAAVTMKKK